MNLVDMFQPEVRSVIVQAEDQAAMVEHSIVGRFPGSRQMHVALWMARYASVLATAGNRNMVHLEIGVLHGGGLVLTALAITTVVEGQFVIGIDPLDGLSMPDRGIHEPVDPKTGVPVSIETVRQNLRACDVQALVLPARSEDVQRWGLADTWDIASAYIDGDHSEATVRSDWEMVRDRVPTGGHVIFDDYSNPDHPGVRATVDAVVAPDRDWEKLGVVDNMIIFRRR